MRKILFIVLFTITSYTVFYAQTRWSFELQSGAAYNVPMPLIISQSGYPDINMNARFYSEPFTPPVCWDWRFSRWQNGTSWEFEAIHHKLYLDNTTHDVEKFNISHGFNILTINRAFERKWFIYRICGGVVLTHPESRIRGKEFGSSFNYTDLSYFVSGPIVVTSANKPIPFNRRFFLNLEAKMSLSYVKLRISEGHAHVYHLAFHIAVGLGTNFIIRDKE